MAEDIKQFSEEIKKHFNEKTEEIKHHMDVVAEDLKGQIQQVAEGVIVSNERLDRLEPLVEKVEVIKVTVNAIKRDLKQKADREELSALELKLRPA